MRTIKRFCLIVIACLLPAGCMSKKEMGKQATLAGSANRLVICQSGADCDEKWSRAVEWVKANSAYGITKQTDSLLETAGPSGMDNHLAFTITKKLIKIPPPLATTAPSANIVTPPVATVTPGLDILPPVPPKDRYNIALFIRCNDWFGCTPTQLEARAAFNTFIIGAPPAAKPVLGAKVAPLTLDMAQKMKIPGGLRGLAVMTVVPHSLADKGGLSEGDIILRYDGTPVMTESALNDLVSNTQPGQHINIDIIHGLKNQTIVVDF
jgi:hypothetical protein